MIEVLIVTLPLILLAFARLIEAYAVVILSRRSDAPLVLSEEGRRPGSRIRLRARLRNPGEASRTD